VVAWVLRVTLIREFRSSLFEKARWLAFHLRKLQTFAAGQRLAIQVHEVCHSNPDASKTPQTHINQSKRFGGTGFIENGELGKSTKYHTEASFSYSMPRPGGGD
jgi:hypothetical protein